MHAGPTARKAAYSKDYRGICKSLFRPPIGRRGEREKRAVRPPADGAEPPADGAEPPADGAEPPAWPAAARPIKAWACPPGTCCPCLASSWPCRPWR
ncbi:hypothetical protein FA216_00740 [Pseudomonas aeruginosa]|nr:hypothetical protein [Pseudomonas aeruginosa]